MTRSRYDQKTKRYQKLIVLIWGTVSAKDITIERLATAIGVSDSTIYSRKRNPGDFSIEELCRIGRHLNIPIEELRQCITY